MCYEFNLWSRKLRSEDQARKQAQKPEPAARQPAPAPQAQPLAAEAKVEKREEVPA